MVLSSLKNLSLKSDKIVYPSTKLSTKLLSSTFKTLRQRCHGQFVIYVTVLMLFLILGTVRYAFFFKHTLDSTIRYVMVLVRSIVHDFVKN
jgi:hypothetical protein